MSAEVVLSWPAWAREQRKLGASARACLREIAVLADDRGAAIIEIAWLAQAVDRSERTVWRGLATLEERGLIVREERREEGHRAASRFQLVILFERSIRLALASKNSAPTLIPSQRTRSTSTTMRACAPPSLKPAAMVGTVPARTDSP